MRVNRRLVGGRQRRHGGRPRVVHQPRHQVRAVAAEVEQRAGAVANRVDQPAQKLGADVDLLGPLVPVHRDHLADVACAMVHLEGLPEGRVTRIPGGLVVHDHLDARPRRPSRSIARAPRRPPAAFPSSRECRALRRPPRQRDDRPSLVNVATASGCTRSSIVSRLSKKSSGGRWTSPATCARRAASGSATPTTWTSGCVAASLRKCSTCPCTRPAMARRTGEEARGKRGRGGKGEGGKGPPLRPASRQRPPNTARSANGLMSRILARRRRS